MHAVTKNFPRVKFDESPFEVTVTLKQRRYEKIDSSIAIYHVVRPRAYRPCSGWLQHSPIL